MQDDNSNNNIKKIEKVKLFTYLPNSQEGVLPELN